MRSHADLYNLDTELMKREEVLNHQRSANRALIWFVNNAFFGPNFDITRKAEDLLTFRVELREDDTLLNADARGYLDAAAEEFLPALLARAIELAEEDLGDA